MSEGWDTLGDADSDDERDAGDAAQAPAPEIMPVPEAGGAGHSELSALAGRSPHAAGVTVTPAGARGGAAFWAAGGARPVPAGGRDRRASLPIAIPPSPQNDSLLLPGCYGGTASALYLPTGDEGGATHARQRARSSAAASVSTVTFVPPHKMVEQQLSQSMAPAMMQFSSVCELGENRRRRDLSVRNAVMKLTGFIEPAAAASGAEREEEAPGGRPIPRAGSDSNLSSGVAAARSLV